ncbi:tRNA synthetases class I (M)-domain-containing protein [Syncephalis fuscata]|nr:tRNA synthetases class I (M)-domain-containing protein [Syncephalis fuscata]
MATAAPSSSISSILTTVPAVYNSPAHIAQLKFFIATIVSNANITIDENNGKVPLLHVNGVAHPFFVPNAAVRFFLGQSATGELTHNEMIEWEETLPYHNPPTFSSDELNKASTFVESLGQNTENGTLRAVDVILFARFYPWWSAVDSDVRDTYPILSKRIAQLSQLPTIAKAIETLTAKVNVAPPKIIANESHRKINTNYSISLSHDQIKLPIPGQENVLITSALPYVNNVPHLGNIIGAVLSADVYSRFCRIRGINSLYICGTDEYGTATETKALEEGVTCQELCDKFHKLHSDVYKWFEIDFDYFGRTTTPQQTVIAQDIFKGLVKNEYTLIESMTQLYCEQCHRFLADRYVEGTCPKCGYDDARGDQCDGCGQLLNAHELIKPRCKLDGNAPVTRDSKHIFVDLPKLQPACEAFFKESSIKGNWTSNGRTITASWLNEGLKPRCITRDLKWGTPVPYEGMEDKVFYVWYDAPIGYPSITANYTPDWEKWWKNPDEVKLYQFMGKDNVPFHTVIFPSCLMGTNDPWTLLHHLSTTEYLNYEDTKFSKSRNIGVFGDNAQETGVPPSVWRYYLLSSRPETNDSIFTWKEMIAKNNNELLANVGNFCNRVIRFLDSPKYNSVLPAISIESDVEQEKMVADIQALVGQYIDALKQVKIRAALRIAMEVSARGNQYLQDQRLDNALYADQRTRCDTVVGVAANLVYLLASLFFPFMPSTSEAIWRQLNAPPRQLADQWTMDLLPGHRIGEPNIYSNALNRNKK